MKTIKHIILVGFTLQCLACAEAPADGDPIVTNLESFKTDGESRKLDAAATSLKNRVEKLNARQKVEAYIELAGMLAPIFDPNFDTHPPKVFLNLSPGPGYDSGISPGDVADPKVRADYERRIAENNENAKAARIQTAIRKTLDTVARDCAMILNSDDLTIADRENLCLKISNGNLPVRFKTGALHQQRETQTPEQKDEGNKKQNPAGGTTVPGKPKE